MHQILYLILFLSLICITHQQHQCISCPKHMKNASSGLWKDPRVSSVPDLTYGSQGDPRVSRDSSLLTYGYVKEPRVDRDSSLYTYGSWKDPRVSSVPELTYGYYCGKGHYDNYGAIPIDDFDRVCQFHDICVTARGMLDCYCNEQLYWMLSYIKPRTVEQSQLKDYALKGLYASIFSCTNHYDFDAIYYISKMVGSNAPVDQRGFNYLPLYYSFDGTICTDDNALVLFYVNIVDYYNITKLAFNDPSSVLSFNHSIIERNSCIKSTVTDKIVILYNLLTVPRKITYLNDNCQDGRWNPKMIRVINS